MSGVFYRGWLVPARARDLAAELASLFEQDRRLVGRLNDTSRRLAGANRRLWSGLHPDALALLYENTDRDAISRGASMVAGALIDALRTGEDEFDIETAVLPILQETHWSIHRAFLEHRGICEERRQLAARVGELGQQLTDVLGAAGWPAEEARRVSVHELAATRS